MVTLFFSFPRITLQGVDSLIIILSHIVLSLLISPASLSTLGFMSIVLILEKLQPTQEAVFHSMDFSNILYDEIED
jgi:hypothetical protein